MERIAVSQIESKIIKEMYMLCLVMSIYSNSNDTSSFHIILMHVELHTSPCHKEMKADRCSLVMVSKAMMLKTLLLRAS